MYAEKLGEFVLKSHLWLTCSICDCFIQAQFEQLENEMKDSNANYEALMRNFLELTELKHILHKAQTFLKEVTAPCLLH